MSNEPNSEIQPQTPQRNLEDEFNEMREMVHQHTEQLEKLSKKDSSINPLPAIQSSDEHISLFQWIKIMLFGGN